MQDRLNVPLSYPCHTSPCHTQITKLCTDKELKFLTKVSALIDYYLQVHGIEVPEWIRDNKLRFDKPYYHSRRISDFEKLKLQYIYPSPFRARNVYFNLDGLERV